MCSFNLTQNLAKIQINLSKKIIMEDCFKDMSRYVYGIETGLSSDPEMNWQVKDLDERSILSFSDAHSLAKMGREATVLELEKMSYENIKKAFMQPVIHSSLRHPELDLGSHIKKIADHTTRALASKEASARNDNI